MLFYKKIKLPIQNTILVYDDNYIYGLLWLDKESFPNCSKEGIKKTLCTTYQTEVNELTQHPLAEKIELQLTEYFNGQRKVFDLPLKPIGTPFQLKAWNELQKIPYGHTRSYQEQAKAAGSPKGFRAIGSANSKNPISIIIPCHRVIAKSGALSGYAGGVKTKQALLNLEKA